MNIYAAFLSQETNTFSPLPTTLADFDVMVGKDIQAGRKHYRDFQPLGVWEQQAVQLGHNFYFDLAALATPSGIASCNTYETLRDQMLDGLAAKGNLDIVLLNLHGAMVAEGYDDCEGDLIQRVRALVGPRVVIAVELDLHCHLSDAMVQHADIVLTYKEYPHSDIAERGAELLSYALAAATGQTQPTMAVYDCHMLGLYPTTLSPLRDFIDKTLIPAERREGVIAVSFVHGFPWGDVAYGGSKVLVVTDNHPSLAKALAQDLGQQLYALRHQISFPSLSIEQTFARVQALLDKPDPKPIVIADQSDNPGAGAPGDATFALDWLLRNPIGNAAVGIIYDPDTVQQAIAAGVGSAINLQLGGKQGPHSGRSLSISATVTELKKDYWHHWPQEQADPIQWPVGDVVALRCGAIDIIVGSRRCQCFAPNIFSDLSINWAGKDILVVKSAQHFYSAFAPVAREIIYMAGPGAVSPNVLEINYQKMSTVDKYPWSESLMLDELKAYQPVFWSKPHRAASASEVMESLSVNLADIKEAADRLARSAALMQTLFPELEASQGIIESPLLPLRAIKSFVMPGNGQGALYLKADNQLPVVGSIKARGGFYEVLSIAEALAITHKLISPGDDLKSLAQQEAKDLFGQHTISVGSTGNLGLSIGTLASALGFKAEVHMSVDAKPWKKALLRARGVSVIEHRGDYARAVEAARDVAQGNDHCHFVDDENSLTLFLGYSVAALRLQQQLQETDIIVDENHPLLVYLPCGVGGAPGGITFGLKQIFGDHVHCVFAEPVASPCMLMRLAYGEGVYNSVYELGLNNRTDADGLAVASASELVASLVGDLVSGIFTVADQDLYRWLYLLGREEGIQIEPSAAAGFNGPSFIKQYAQGQGAHSQNQLHNTLKNSTQIIWATGGSLVPEPEYRMFYDKGHDINGDAVQD